MKKSHLVEVIKKAFFGALLGILGGFVIAIVIWGITQILNNLLGMIEPVNSYTYKNNSLAYMLVDLTHYGIMGSWIGSVIGAILSGIYTIKEQK